MIYRSNPKNKYIPLPNETVQDGSLSMKASGLLHYMLSLPVDWGFNVQFLVNHFKHDGETAIRSGLNELEEANYLIRKRKRKGGKFVGEDWTVLDTKAISPHAENPHVDNPHVEKTHVDNRRLQKTHSTNNIRDKQHSDSSGSDEHDLMMISNRAQQLFGTSVTPTDYQRLSDYHDDLSAKLMLKGFDIAEKHHAYNIKYIFSIFTRWCSNGYHSLNDFKNSSKQKGNSSNQGRQSPNQPKSQDEVDKENEAQAAKDEERINKMMEGRK